MVKQFCRQSQRLIAKYSTQELCARISGEISAALSEVLPTVLLSADAVSGRTMHAKQKIPKMNLSALASKHDLVTIATTSNCETTFCAELSE